MRPPAVSDSPAILDSDPAAPDADLPTIPAAETPFGPSTTLDEPTTTYPDEALNRRHTEFRGSQAAQRRLWAAVNAVAEASVLRTEPDFRGRPADDLGGLTRIDERDERDFEVANRYARRLRRRRERTGLAGS